MIWLWIAIGLVASVGFSLLVAAAMAVGMGTHPRSPLPDRAEDGEEGEAWVLRPAAAPPQRRAPRPNEALTMRAQGAFARVERKVTTR